ncbi:sporulation YhaL family protein [Radiobacillus sp. PE A8.2]|uniref:sporulation YhaL family protein n=1 Tax=Radiobacillus sp. PE A8.2 TaxID=3380349 RepID=UPI00388D2F95
MLFGVPWWVFLFILCIAFCGYMSFRAMIAERQLEKFYIEREGKVYLDRIKDERDKKSDEKSKEVISS